MDKNNIEANAGSFWMLAKKLSSQTEQNKTKQSLS
jgi:hypothetical protein